MIAQLMFLSLVAISTAGPWFPWVGFPYNPGYFGYYGHPGFHDYDYGYRFHPKGYGHVPSSKLIYYGDFTGSCKDAPDGLYYVDEYSFAYCSNGKKTIQPCAEGSANPDPSYFNPGGYYGFYDFCAVNLVAYGYNDNRPVYEEEVKYSREADHKAPPVKVTHEKYYEETHGYEPEKKAN